MGTIWWALIASSASSKTFSVASMVPSAWRGRATGGWEEVSIDLKHREGIGKSKYLQRYHLTYRLGLTGYLVRPQVGTNLVVVSARRIGTDTVDSHA